MGYDWLPGLLAVLTDVLEHEVLQGLHHHPRRPQPLTDPYGNRYLAIHTRTDAGRPIVVTVRLAGGFDATIIAARPMTPAETAHLEQWEQNHA